MAKVIGPLLSVGAKGKIAKVMYYQGSVSGTVVRRLPRQPQITNAYQLQKQIWYADAVAHWHLLSDTQRELWNNYQDGRGNVGYHAFISQYLRHLISETLPWKLPDGTLWEAEIGKTAIAGFAIAGVMVFGYTG